MKSASANAFVPLLMYKTRYKYETISTLFNILFKNCGSSLTSSVPISAIVLLLTDLSDRIKLPLGVGRGFEITQSNLATSLLSNCFLNYCQVILLVLILNLCRVSISSMSYIPVDLVFLQRLKSAKTYLFWMTH